LRKTVKADEKSDEPDEIHVAYARRRSADNETVTLAPNLR